MSSTGRGENQTSYHTVHDDTSLREPREPYNVSGNHGAENVMILEMEALVQVKAVKELETGDPMDMEVQGMVEAEEMAVMEVTEAMEIRMAQDQIMTDSVTRRRS